MSAQVISEAPVCAAIKRKPVEKSDVGSERVIEVVVSIFKALALIALCVTACVIPPVGLVLLSLVGEEFVVESLSAIGSGICGVASRCFGSCGKKTSTPPQPIEHLAHLDDSPGLDAYGNLNVGPKQQSALIKKKIKVMDREKGYVEKEIKVPPEFLHFVYTQSEHIFIGADSLATLLARKQVSMKDAAPWLLEHLFSLLPTYLTADEKIAVLSRIAANLTNDSLRYLGQLSEKMVDNRTHDPFDTCLVSRQKKISIAIPEACETMRVLMCCDRTFKEENGNRLIGVRASLELDIAIRELRGYIKEANFETGEEETEWRVVSEPGRLFAPEIQITTRLLTAS